MDSISVYTDGSCSTAHRIGAWASIILFGSEKKILNGHAFATTHQRMELTAVINALKYLNKNNLTQKQITIYTDSQYVKGLHQRKEKLLSTDFITKKNRLLANADLISTLFKETENLHLAIIKVKSHQTLSYHEKLNSEADKLCRKIVREWIERSGLTGV